MDTPKLGEKMIKVKMRDTEILYIGNDYNPIL